MVCSLLATVPFARAPLPGTEILLPAYAAALLVNELITATLLLALFRVQRSRALLFLACGFIFSGLLVIPWALTFPGVFTALGIEGGLQSTASVAAIRRVGFPLFVLAYAVLKDREPMRGSAFGAIGAAVVSTAAAAGFVTWLIVASEESLPSFMKDARKAGELWQYVPPAAITLYIAGLTIIGSRRRSILDLWLIVVLSTLLIEIVLLSFVSAGIRLSVGWWVGRICGLASASIVLIVLLSETTALYTRLAQSISAERRARANRLVAMEALSASIAHEIRQPLTSMVTNADAGLRWLRQERPRLDETTAALKRIAADGHRASKVIEGIRGLFVKGAEERVRLDLNPLIEEVLAATEAEARSAGIMIKADLDGGLPPILGDQAQLQQVASNLVSNAVDALRGTPGARELRVASRRWEHGEVLVSFEDTGVGLDPGKEERIFEPFVTTKPDGMGVGLMVCRSTIEAHGGRLWASANRPAGAIFRFTLPAATDPVPEEDA